VRKPHIEKIAAITYARTEACIESQRTRKISNVGGSRELREEGERPGQKKSR